MSNPEDPELWVTSGSATFVFVPETFHFDSGYTIDDFWQDLVELALRDHVQYPVAVFYRKSAEE